MLLRNIRLDALRGDGALQASSPCAVGRGVHPANVVADASQIRRKLGRNAEARDSLHDFGASSRVLFSVSLTS
jgi:hypothetical protein